MLKESPFIHGFRSNRPISSSLNYSLIVDDYGILYLGQENKISIYNGVFWNYIAAKGEIHLCRNENNVVFFSGDKTLGFLKSDSLNKLVTISIKEKLPQKYQSFNKVKNICSLGESVFFHIDDALLIYNSEKFKVLLENSPDAYLCKADEKIIYASPNGAIFVYTREIRETKYHTRIYNICSIIPAMNFLLIFDTKNNLYKVDTSFNLLYKKHLPFINSVTLGSRLNNENFLIADSGNSLFIVDQHGVLINQLDNLPELPRSKIAGFLNEPGRGIWILQEKSLNLLEYPFMTNRIFSLAKDSGIIHDIKINDNKLFLATTKGVFYLDPYKNKIHSLSIPGFCNRLIPVHEGLCAISTDKIYLIRNKKAEIIFLGKVLDYSYLPDTKILYISSPSGIKAFEFNGEKINTLYLLKTSITPLKILAHKNFLWYTDSENLFSGSFDDSGTWTDKKIDVPGKESIMDLFIRGNKLNLLLSDKVFSLTDDTFSLEENISNIFQNGVVYNYGEDSKGNLILLTRDPQNHLMLWYGNKTSVSLNSVMLPSSVDFSIPSFEFSGQSKLIFSSGSDIFTLDVKSFPVNKPIIRTNITGIFTLYDTLFFGPSHEYLSPLQQKKLNRIPYRQRNIKIRLISSDFFDRNPLYQYAFNVNEKNWSAWSDDPGISLNNLKEGRYDLLIRSRNSSGDPGLVSSLTFRILPPLYRSKPAYLIYFFILVLLSFITYKTSRLNIHSARRVIVSPDSGDIPAVIESLPVSQPLVSNKYNAFSNIEPDKGKVHARWDKFDMVTVLFSDIQGFTKIAESTNPEVLIDELDRFFFHFDSVVEKYNIEKIKTIGDAYMAAGGIPQKNNCNPIEVVLAALEMQLFMKQLKNTNVDIWDLRIGIHTGPVIAGEIGHKKRSFDIWGDTVNIASRMESSGEPGKVNISAVTYNFVKDYFICEYRGKLPVKYKGNIDMYFVRALRPELSIDLASIPNRRLYLKLQMLRLIDLEEIVFAKLENELPKDLYFHNPDYARHQYEYAGLLSKAENLDGEETLMIKTSALLMNIGYIYTYENQENKSAEFARTILPEFKYSEKQIISISNLILATKWPSEPQSITEKVIYDIKMEYLGRADYLELYKLLFLEQKGYQSTRNIEEFKQQQNQILENHRFYTKTASRLQEVSQEEQLKKVLDDDWQ